MSGILRLLSQFDVTSLNDRDILITEGDQTRDLYVLVAGKLEVYKSTKLITTISSSGSVVGEMSVLLNSPHTATIKAKGICSLYRIPDASEFVRNNPDISWHIANLLAKRLTAATSYLVDKGNQFKESNNHVNLIPEMLETLIMYNERDLV